MQLLRWLTVFAVAAGGGWLAYSLAELALGRVSSGSADWRLLLLLGYGFLILGYVFAALGTSLAPSGRYSVAVSLVFVTVLVAALLVLGNDASFFPATLLAIALVAGAVGHAMRLRGFTERISVSEA
jgi:drug/metabolite transporter (DMT)-like permease